MLYFPILMAVLSVYVIYQQNIYSTHSFFPSTWVNFKWLWLVWKKRDFSTHYILAFLILMKFLSYDY